MSFINFKIFLKFINKIYKIFFRFYSIVFSVSPVSFNERMSQGARIISSSHSVGGNFVVMGDTHRFVRIYKMASDGIEKCFEIEAHKVLILFFL